MTTATLPDKPSELIRVALADLVKVEAMPETYSVSMGVWHHRSRTGKCFVCLAGSVMAGSLGADASATMNPNHYDPLTRRKLMALDSLRCGYVNDALEHLGLDQAGMRDVPGASYHAHSAKSFHTDMAKLADDLEAAGL